MSHAELLTELSNVQHESVFADCVKADPEKAVPMIKDQIKDHRLKVVEIIGERLVTVIENL